MPPLAVPPDLLRVISQALSYREVFPTHMEIWERVLPDGAVRIVVDLSRPAILPNIAVVGPRTTAELVRLSGRVEGMSLTLSPAVAMAVLGVPIGEIADRTLPLGDLWGPSAAELCERLLAASGNHGRGELIWTSVRARLSERDDPAPPALLRVVGAAATVTAAGGRGIAMACDHADPDAVSELVRRIEAEAGRIDLLVNNAWGGHESFDGRFNAPFWEHPLSHWDAMMDRGVCLHLLAARAVAPAMTARGSGLIIATTFWDQGRFLRGNLYYDLAKAAINRPAFGIAEELRPSGVASVALSPGWMRTEWVLAGHRTDEAHWNGVPALARTESPRYLGRAVVALAGDPDVMRHSGQVLRVADLAEAYGFEDVGGWRVPAFELPES